MDEEEALRNALGHMEFPPPHALEPPLESALQPSLQQSALQESALQPWQFLCSTVPSVLLFLASASILAVTQFADGPTQEQFAPELGMILSFCTLGTTLWGIGYQGPSLFPATRCTLRVSIRFQLVQAIIMPVFLSSMKNGGRFATFQLWSAMCTVPILILSVAPLLMQTCVE